MRFRLLMLICAAGALPLYAQAGMSCQSAASSQTKLRAEGHADLVSDVVLSCTGGSPAAAGATVPQYQILVVSNTPYTVRTVPAPAATPSSVTPPAAPLMPWTDALLVLDEASGSAQIPCVPAGSAVSCPGTAGASGPNAFQGQLLQSNIVLFQQIPIDAPGAGKTRTIRITNLRVDSVQIPTTPAPPQVTLQTQIFDHNGNLIPLGNASQVAATPQASYTVELRTPDDQPVSAGPALTVTPSMLPQSTPGANLAFHVKFSEAFPGAFKRRNLGTSGADPNLVVSQADPGVPSNTESGLYNSLFPSANNLDLAGLADSGTRLMLVLSQIPNNVQLEVSARDVAAGTSDYSAAAPRAILTYTDQNGAGSFSQNHPGVGTFSVFFPTNGTIALVWEVVATDPSKAEDFSFEIRLFAPNGLPVLGTALALGSLAPIYPGVQDPNVPTTVMPIPSFKATAASPVPAFSLVPTLNVAKFTSVSAASFAGPAVAPGSIVSGFGQSLSSVTDVPSGGSPVAGLDGIQINIIDNAGNLTNPLLLLISPGQINFLLDPSTASGEAVVNVLNDTQTVGTGYLNVQPVAPGLFSATGNGQGVAAGSVTQVISGDTVSAELAQYNSTQQAWASIPINLSGNPTTMLTLYGTGVRNFSSLSNVSLSVGGTNVPVTFAGAQPQFAGLDQINAGPLPASLAGSGQVPVILTVDGQKSNALTIQIQ